MRALVFCADKKLQAFLQRQLQVWGWTVTFTSSTGPAGVRLLHSQEPDLVVVDDGLTSGFNIRKFLDVIDQGPRLPVILLLSPANPLGEELLASTCVVAACAKPVREVDFYLALLQAEANFAKITALKQEVGQLRERLETRKVVEKAKGILMKTLGISEEEAYRRIQRESMERRTSMRTIAEAIIQASKFYQVKEEKS
ncbi:response regulator receiver and ANTAR domain protein [Ammonifex degensii KC4]|uniref:Stage 0 sporulation protein A homolog n=1 Tax=Ammonifex degensii (strain DSM 10501 / KC4) TaxID=429009 RepID=C9R9J1_AMMDK|nr:ANTAR domain-containing protein [Ammonifex degensii]ACX52970.1 response regulator receiver and ANTAR domain protein [Ammonifex degensii KC4]